MPKKLAAVPIVWSLFLAAAGCTTIDEHVRVPDWPQLAVVEHEVPYGQMYARCKKYTGFFMTPLGCTEFNFQARRADIYVSPGLGMKTVLEHERLHAQGYDHPGSGHMAKLWHDWAASHPEVASSRAGGVAASGLMP